jgi:hypothetical protein
MRIIFIFLLTLSSFAQETQNTTPELSSGNVKSVSENKGLVSGEDIDQSDPYMDALYQRGPYLVYDCVTRHWVCTKELEYKRCLDNRKEALLDYKTILPCAHFDVFNRREDCWQRQQELTNSAKYEQFCYHPSKLQNKLNF